MRKAVAKTKALRQRPRSPAAPKLQGERAAETAGKTRRRQSLSPERTDLSTAAPPIITGKEIGADYYDCMYVADQFTVARNGCMNLALSEARLLKDEHAEPRQLARLKIERAKFQLRAKATVLFKKLTEEGLFKNKGNSNTPTKTAISNFEEFFLGTESGVWKSIEEACEVLRAETLHLKVQANRDKVDLDSLDKGHVHYLLSQTHVWEVRGGRSLASPVRS